MTFWVWPLPPAGPLVFVCEWPKYRIPLTRKEIDAGLIRDAAKLMIELWPEEEPGRKSDATPRLRTAVGLDVPDQLRMYTIKPGAMAAWLEGRGRRRQPGRGRGESAQRHRCA